MNFFKAKKCLSTLGLLSIAGAAASGQAATLYLKSGYVRYEVEVRTLGIGGDNIVGTNGNVLGKITTMGGGAVEGGLIVPVVEFDSNNSKRDKDVANILKYKEYPAITFEVVDIDSADIHRVLDADSGTVKVKVNIAAAGGSKTYDIDVNFRSAGMNEIIFTTRIGAKFTDFGIKPPRLGLIFKTAPDRLVLSGELLFGVKR